MENSIGDREDDAPDPSSGQPIPASGTGGDRGEPQGPGGSEGQIDREYRWPTFAEVRDILYELAEGLAEAGGEPLPAFQIENQSYLESALGLPHQPYYGTFSSALAAMVRSIAANHALVDGNKRLAVTVLHSTLLVNGFIYLWDNDDAVALVLRCATGETDYRWLAEFIELWAPPAVGGEVRVEAGWLREQMAGRREILSTTWRDRTALRQLMADHARGLSDPGVIASLLEAARSGGSLLSERQ